MKKYEIAYYSYAEAKRAHEVQKWFIKTLQMALCVRSKQPRTIKTITHNDIFTSLRRKKVQSPAKQFKEWFSLVSYYFCTAFTLTNQNWVTFSCSLSEKKNKRKDKKRKKGQKKILNAIFSFLQSIFIQIWLISNNNTRVATNV